MRGKWPHGKEKGAETSHGWKWINLPRVVHRLFPSLFKSIIILVCFNVLLELSIKTKEEKFHEQCDGDWFIPTSFPSRFMYRHGMWVVLIVEARMIQVYADVYSGDFLLVKSSVFLQTVTSKPNSTGLNADWLKFRSSGTNSQNIILVPLSRIEPFERRNAPFFVNIYSVMKALAVAPSFG